MKDMFETVLVLNANFEPINVCGMRRAIGLLLGDKASMVLNGRGYIHTSRNAFPRPSVIRLNYMVHRPRPQVKLTRRELFRRDNFTCQYCGKKKSNLTVDHVLPRHLGGQQAWENVVTACAECNHRKGGRTVKEAGMVLIKIPKAPPNSIKYIFAHHLNQYDEWVPFIEGW
jgi:5-methylcytosine-specific restriction endonuclease McrA